jgi:hypothetical protein
MGLGNRCVALETFKGWEEEPVSRIREEKI